MPCQNYVIMKIQNFSKRALRMNSGALGAGSEGQGGAKGCNCSDASTPRIIVNTENAVTQIEPED